MLVTESTRPAHQPQYPCLKQGPQVVKDRQIVGEELTTHIQTLGGNILKELEVALDSCEVSVQRGKTGEDFSMP